MVNFCVVVWQAGERNRAVPSCMWHRIPRKRDCTSKQPSRAELLGCTVHIPGEELCPPSLPALHTWLWHSLSSGVPAPHIPQHVCCSWSGRESSAAQVTSRGKSAAGNHWADASSAVVDWCSHSAYSWGDATLHQVMHSAHQNLIFSSALTHRLMEWCGLEGTV